MPPPTVYTPSAVGLGGPATVPIMHVTIPLSNSGANTTAKLSETCPIMLRSLSSFTGMAATCEC